MPNENKGTAVQKDNKQRDGLPTWNRELPIVVQCNGCSDLDFRHTFCPKLNRTLNTFINGKGFISVIKPTDCPKLPKNDLADVV